MGSGVVVLGLVVAAACTKPNPAANCDGNGVCTDPSHPYCDVDGSISGDPNTCVAVSCTAGGFKSCAGSNSALVCNAGGNGYDTQSCAYGCDPNTGCESGSGGGSGSCTANAVLRCDGQQLVSCNAAGTGEVTQACALGCDGAGPRCKGVDPSNGLATYLDQATQQGDVTLPDGTTIDTDNGTVNGPGGAIALATTIISQTNGPMLRVLMAKSFTTGNVRVTGTAALAIVSAGDITINGVLDLSADNVKGGAGAVTCTSSGLGDSQDRGCFRQSPPATPAGTPIIFGPSAAAVVAVLARSAASGAPGIRRAPAGAAAPSTASPRSFRSAAAVPAETSRAAPMAARVAVQSSSSRTPPCTSSTVARRRDRFTSVAVAVAQVTSAGSTCPIPMRYTHRAAVAPVARFSSRRARSCSMPTPGSWRRAAAEERAGARVRPQRTVRMHRRARAHPRVVRAPQTRRPPS